MAASEGGRVGTVVGAAVVFVVIGAIWVGAMGGSDVNAFVGASFSCVATAATVGILVGAPATRVGCDKITGVDGVLHAATYVISNKLKLPKPHPLNRWIAI